MELTTFTITNEEVEVKDLFRLLKDNGYKVNIITDRSKDTAKEKKQLKISSLSSAANKLRQSEKRRETLQQYMDIAGVIIVSLNRNERITFVNKRGCEVFGLPRHELLGINYFERLVPVQMRKSSKAFFRNGISNFNEDIYSFENQIIDSHGQERTILWTNAPIRDKDGIIVEMVSSGTDITEKKLIDKRLERSEKKYKALVEATNTGYVIIDQQRNVLDANDQYALLAGYQLKEDIIGKSVDNWIATHDLIRSKKNTAACFDSGDVKKYEIDYVNREGGVTPVEVSTSSIELENENIIIALCWDISERKKIERERYSHEQQLIQADKMVSLGVLVSGVAHEINNPNNFIMLNVPLLTKAWSGILPILDRHYQKEGDFTVGKRLQYSKIKDAVPVLMNGILEGSQRIKNIVSDLKDYARMEEPMLCEGLDINEIIAAASRLTANLIKKSTKNFTLSLADNLPSCRGQFQRLEQVFINMIENSCQSLGDVSKGITITTFSDEDNKSIVAEVSDEGLGMDDDTLKQISDPFFTTKRTKGGTGLGVSVSSKIIHNHGGTLQYFSRPGKGTRVKIAIPVSEG